MDKISYRNMKDNIFKIYTTQKEQPETNNTKEISELLKKLSNDAERYVPEYGEFGVVKKEFSNKEKDLDISEVVFSVKPSVLLDERPKEREFEIVVMSKNRLNKYSTVLLRGEKADILQRLAEDSTVLKVEEFLQEANKKFENLR